MARVAPPIVLTPEQALELQRSVPTAGATQREALRARIVLLAASGWRNDRIARELEVTPTTVSNWRYRFARLGMAGLADAPRPGRPLAHLPAEVRRMLEQMTRPPEGQTRWTCRSMAEHTGLSRSGVQRLWERLNLRPQLTQAAVPPVVADAPPRVWDVVGLYLVPPIEALAMYSAENDHAEASNRSRSDSDHGAAPGRPVRLDDYRDRTLALCAVLNYLGGKISAQSGCHNHVEDWLRFLRRIDAEVPPGLAVHLIVSNCPTRKVPEVKIWLRRHPRFWVHFPTSGSTWLSEVERFFREQNRITTPSDSLDGLSELGQAICHFLADHNLRPQHYIWCAERARILERIERVCPKASPIPEPGRAELPLSPNLEAAQQHRPTRFRASEQVRTEPGYLPAASGPITAGGGTVLMVEDEPAISKLVTRTLKRQGFTVLAAEDGVEAVEIFRQHQDEIDCVLCDLTMPRMNGWETLTALRKLAPGIPVILSSGYIEAQVMEGHHPELPQAFLSKPYDHKALINAINQVLANPKG